MLTAYLDRTRRLLRNPAAGTALYSDEDLTAYINEARGQLAGESQCIRNLSTIDITTGDQKFDFADITIGAPSDGIAGVFNVRQVLVGSGMGKVLLTGRGFPYFTLFHLGSAVVSTGQPEVWAQFGQGVTGSIYLDPISDGDYTLYLDTVCQPSDLEDDTDDEAIPYPWQDAVPFYAAYFALLSSQRKAEAKEYFDTYQLYVARARAISNPDQLSENFAQSRDPTIQNKLGMGERDRER